MSKQEKKDKPRMPVVSAEEQEAREYERATRRCFKCRAFLTDCQCGKLYTESHYGCYD